MIRPLSCAATATEIAEAVGAGEVKAAAVVDATLNRLSTAEPKINGFTDIVAARARRRAAEFDGCRSLKPLAGVPFAVKNLFDIEGLSTRAGSKIGAEGPGAKRDATLIRRLESAGAVLIGALNMGEYAYDFTGQNAHYGPSKNPHDTTRMTGGSSGGCGAALAAGEVPLALGSDTNGSIRVPSALCGVFGLKPTYGRLSRTGTFPFVDSLDHLGPMSRSVADLALAFDAMQGPDAADPACSGLAADPTFPRLLEGIGGLRIALAGGYFAEGAESAVFSALARVAEALNVDRTVIIPDVPAARAAAHVITAAEGSELHLQRLRTRPQDFDPATRQRFMAGALIPAAWYLQAQRFRRLFRSRIASLFDEVDVVLAPAAPCIAPRLGQETISINGVEGSVRATLGRFTQPISLVGLPVVSAPVARPTGMPVGIQLIGRSFDEQSILRVAAYLEALGICVSTPASEEDA